MRGNPTIIDTMARRPRLGLERKGFSLWKKTWLILKELEFKSAQTDNKKDMVSIAHDAISEYAAKNTAGSKEDKNAKVKK